MVKLYASLLSLTLITSLALAAPHPSYTHYHNRDLLERDLDEEFFGREYLSDAYEDLAAREPSFFGNIGNAIKGVGRIAKKGLEVAEKVAENPLVQTAVSLVPGGSAVMAAEKVFKAIRTVKKFENLANKARAAGRTVHKLEHLGGALRKGKTIDRAIMKPKEADRKVGKLSKHLGGALGKVNKAIKVAKQVHKIASAHNSAHQTAGRRHHRRDLEDNEELSRRDLDDEEFFGREYDDFLVERDFSDDLD